jgi:hypothetical protein
MAAVETDGTKLLRDGLDDPTPVAQRASNHHSKSRRSSGGREESGSLDSNYDFLKHFHPFERIPLTLDQWLDRDLPDSDYGQSVFGGPTKKSACWISIALQRLKPRGAACSTRDPKRSALLDLEISIVDPSRD